MLNLTPEKRRHHLRMRRLDKARKKAGWKEERKRDFSSVKWGCKLLRFILPTSKLGRFIFPTKAILVEKNRNPTIKKDVFVEFNKHGNVERVIGVDDDINYTYLLNDQKYGASLVEPLTGSVIPNSRVVEPLTGDVSVNPFAVSFMVRILKICVFLLICEVLFPFLWAYDLFKSSVEWRVDESKLAYYLWGFWHALKLAWYPFFLAYYIIKDCREIQADTSLWALLKRLFE
ncbi:MAG: hypothetical protein OYL97_24155 [Candidatus Poribacteria bacterium]|nr:hypothetical protein [Candidatus Poribacteria bacterium]